MKIISGISYLVLILFLGYGITSLILKRKRISLCEIFFLSSAVGAGALGFILFWLSLLGFKPSGLILLCITFFAVSNIYCQYKRGSLLTFTKSSEALPGFYRKSWWVVFPVLFILSLMTVLVVVNALLIPLYDIDAFAIWGLKAKVLVYEDLRSASYFYSLPLSFSHLEYPLLVPFLTSGVYAAIGYIDDLVGRIIYPLLYLSLMCLSYTALRWKLREKESFILCAIMMSLPALIRWSGAGVVDMVLTLFYGGSIYYITRFLNEKDSRDLTLAMMFTAFCAFTKNEGLALALINIIVFLFFNLMTGFKKRNLVISAYFVSGVLLLLLPWFIWSKDIPKTYENYPSRIDNAFFFENIFRLRVIIPEFLKQFIYFERWGAFWLLLPVFAVLGWKAFQKQHTVIMWVFFALHIFLYIFIFIITPWDPEHLALMSLERLLLHSTPAVLLLIAFHWEAA